MISTLFFVPSLETYNTEHSHHLKLTTMSAASEVEWTDSSLFSPPIWRTEPDLAVMETIVRTHLDLPVHSPCDITFLGQGFYNKAFKVESDVGIHVIRVSLPIEAPHKMISEVATMRAVIEWVGGLSHFVSSFMIRLGCDVCWLLTSPSLLLTFRGGSLCHSGHWMSTDSLD